VILDPMPEEYPPPDLVELARKQLDAVNRRDLDTVMSVLAPDAVYDTAPSGMGTYEGHAAIGAFLKGYWEAFEELRFELEEALDLGDGVTFHVNRQLARPVGSTADVRTREAHVIEWVADVVVRMTVYNDIEEGRAAAERLAEARRKAPGGVERR
jgi:ketosteroid isomerase-like protein